MWKSLLVSVLKFLGPSLLEWGSKKLAPAVPAEAPAETSAEPTSLETTK